MGQRIEIGPLIFETHNRLLAGLAVDAHVGQPIADPHRSPIWIKAAGVL
jgi:hypothetical protein